MPNPKEVNSESENLNSNEFLEFLDQPVQDFPAPDLPEPEPEEVPGFDFLNEEEDEEKLTPAQRRSMSSKAALRYVKLFDKGFSNLAAVYASGEVNDYKIDTDDQNDLADPLAVLIAENKILDLPPGWALIITALIIYAPLAMKAIGERKDAKAIEKVAVKETEVLEVVEESNKEESK